tara:strand:- start:18168 stop:18911 length:744 start_codon:yes stop_codon:yes gene_type:complete
MQRAGRQTTAQAIVLRRRDFRETSRIVTCITREHGKVTGLAKGAHRPDSPLLGRIDFLNELTASFSPDRGGLRILVRAKLTRERRALRTPQRFLAAGHIAWLVDVASLEGRADPELFDLLLGGLNLLERCPLATIPQVVLGLELRHLEAVGALPDFDTCGECGVALRDQAFRQEDTMGLACRQHAGLPRYPVLNAAMELLRTLRATSGRDWPTLEVGSETKPAATMTALWLAAAVEQRAPYRGLIFA